MSINTSRRGFALLVAIVLLIFLQTHTYLLTQQYVVSSYQGVDDIYEVVIHDDYNFTAFLSDVDTMINYGEFLGVKVSRGMMEEILVVRQGDSSIHRIFVEEELEPAVDGKDVIYEFAGYYVKKRVGPSYIQTSLLQNFKGILHTVCLDTNFTLALRFANSSKVFEYSTASVEALILNFKAFVITFLVETNTTEDIVVSKVDDNVFIKYVSRYPCLSIAMVARSSIEDLIPLLNNISMADIYRYVDASKDLYYKYVSALPRLIISAKMIQDLYYASLYNRLNTLLYPEIYRDTDLSRIANYLMSTRIFKLSGRELYKILDKLFTKLNLNNSYDIFIGLEIAKLLNDKEKLDTICSSVKKIESINNPIELAISSKVLSACGIEGSREIATTLLLNLLPSDILALSELGVAPPSILQIIGIDKLPTPNSCWECLSYSQAIKLLEPSLTDILLYLRNTRARYTCVDYIVIAVFGGIDLVDNDVLLLTPTIPTPNEVLYIVIKIGDSNINVIYNGWGREVGSVKVNGVPVHMTTISINMLRDKVNIIEIEMAEKVVKLDVIVMDDGIPLKGVPVAIEITQQKAGYSMFSITDSDGRAVFVVNPRSYLVISVNLPDLGLLRLRTWVSDRDSTIVIDVSKLLNRLGYINASIQFLERRILDLEKSIEAIKSKSTVTQTFSQEVSLTGIQNTLSIITLSISAIALGVALINIRRKGV